MEANTFELVDEFATSSNHVVAKQIKITFFSLGNDPASTFIALAIVWHQPTLDSSVGRAEDCRWFSSRYP